MKREDWPQEVPRTWKLANFRPSAAEREQRRRQPSRIANRAGMDPQHLVNIRTLECTLCHERRQIHAHHMKSGSAARERGVGMKATDRRCIPLCFAHHDEIERLPAWREPYWLMAFGIDGEALAQGLWNKKGDAVAMDFVLRAHKQQAIRVLSSKRSLIVDLKSGEWRRQP